MEDKITLQVRITGEYAPRIYTMTGKDFDMMLAAVKALPERSFDPVQRLWKVRLAAIKTLQEQGFEVKKDSDFYVFPAHDPNSLHIRNNIMPVDVDVAIRGESGNTPTLPQRSPTVLIHMTDECIQRVQDEHNEKLKSYGIDIPNVPDNYTGYRLLAKLATEAYGERLRTEFKKHYGKRTLDDIKAAKRAVNALIKEDEGLDETGHVHYFTYETVIVDGKVAVRPLHLEEVH